jgi:Tfp pilus assembly protein PilO
VVGDFHSIAAFLTNVGSLTRIVAPVNLQLAPVQQGSAGPGMSTLNRNKSMLSSKFEIQTYVAKGASANVDQPAHGRPPKPGA